VHNSKLSKFDRIGFSPYGLLNRTSPASLKATQDRTPALGHRIGGAGKLSLCGNHIINIVRPDFHLRVSVILKEQLSIYRESRINYQLHYMRRQK